MINTQGNKPNFFLFTGGPGAGKTSVINALQQLGYLVVPEVARTIIKRQNAIGGNFTHYGNRIAYRDEMLKYSIKDFIRELTSTDPVYFDRGLPDLYSYSSRFCGEVTAEVTAAIVQYRYNSQAFLFPPWPDIYCHDAERKQTLKEAVETYEAVKAGYTRCGYQLLEVPKDSVKNRVDFILASCI